jgi:hypothetical protein
VTCASVDPRIVPERLEDPGPRGVRDTASVAILFQPRDAPGAALRDALAGEIEKAALQFTMARAADPLAGADRERA